MLNVVDQRWSRSPELGRVPITVVVTEALKLCNVKVLNIVDICMMSLELSSRQTGRSTGFCQER